MTRKRSSPGVVSTGAQGNCVSDQQRRSSIAGVSNNPAVDLCVSIGGETDRVFFQQNPDRSHRARLSTPDEVNALAALGVPDLPAEMWWWTVVRQLAPGIRHRRFRSFPLIDGESEVAAAAMYGRRS